jgi:Zn-finger nucleic acid-binding protein
VRCPACAHELRSARHRGIELRRCPRCEGAWLDRDGLHHILQRVPAAGQGREAPAAPVGRRVEPCPADVPFYDFG